MGQLNVGQQGEKEIKMAIQLLERQWGEKK
jgi:hypothetical protein